MVKKIIKVSLDDEDLDQIAILNKMIIDSYSQVNILTPKKKTVKKKFDGPKEKKISKPSYRTNERW